MMFGLSGPNRERNILVPRGRKIVRLGVVPQPAPAVAHRFSKACQSREGGSRSAWCSENRSTRILPEARAAGARGPFGAASGGVELEDGLGLLKEEEAKRPPRSVGNGSS